MSAQPIDLAPDGVPGQAALPFDVEHVPVLDPVIDAVTTGLDAGESPHAIAKGLGLKLESVRKHLTRHGRRDLLDALSAAHPRGAVHTGGNPGPRLRAVPEQRAARLEEDGRVPCQDDPEAWFAEREADAADAVAKCGGCPAREACLRVALDRREEWGVWGGLTAAERRRMLAEKAGAAS